jgi:hypothetical protein
VSSVVERSDSVERREDRQNWPSAGVLALALLISALNARRSCGVVSFPSAEFCFEGTCSAAREKMSIVWAVAGAPRGDSVRRTVQSSPRRLVVGALYLGFQLPSSSLAAQARARRIMPE